MGLRQVQVPPFSTPPVSRGLQCCQPGDITVTPVPGGFLIGRVLPHGGAGPWWESIEVCANQRVAITEALRLAETMKVHAWLCREVGDYAPICNTVIVSQTVR